MADATTVPLPSADDREAWLEARKRFLSASDVAVALGLVPGRAKLLRAKAGRPSPSDLKDEPIDDMAQVAAGRFLEAGIFAWFKSETIHTTGSMCGQLMQSPVEPRLAATPDAILDGDPVELKCSGEDTMPNWHEAQKVVLPKCWGDLPRPVDFRCRVPLANNRVRPDARDPRSEWRRSRQHQHSVLLPALGEPRAPLKYLVQLQVQMHVLSADHGWLVGAIGGTRRYDFLYARDRAFEQLFLAETARFWSDVTKLKERE